MKEFSRFFPAACAALLLQAAALPATAQQSRQFSLPKAAGTAAVGGQIDWPSGKLKNWNGPVVMFVPSLIGTDRDGWSLLALAAPGKEWTPFKALSEALVRKGFAVVRFDAPAVMPPSMSCRDTIRRLGLDETTVTGHCLKMDVLLHSTVDTHFASAEQVAVQVQKWAPGAKHQLILAALGQDIHVAAQIADRGNIRVHGIATVGGPASTFSEANRLQTVERAMKILPQFDSNGDGFVHNDEIKAGYAKGIGNFIGLGDWLNAGDGWSGQNKGELRARLNEQHQAMMTQAGCSGKDSGCIHTRQIRGVTIPVLNGATVHYLQHSKAAVDVMAARRIPGLFIWGDKSEAVSVDEQAKLAGEVWRNGAAVNIVRYAQRHQFLSSWGDEEWMEKDMADAVAGNMRDFVNQHLSGMQSQAAATALPVHSLK